MRLKIAKLDENYSMQKMLVRLKIRHPYMSEMAKLAEKLLKITIYHKIATSLPQDLTYVTKSRLGLPVPVMAVVFFSQLNYNFG